MSSSNPWLPILTAGTSGRALELALAKPPGTLSRAPLPLPLEELSKPALENLTTVHRALVLRIPAVSHLEGATWAEWDLVSDAAVSSEKPSSRQHDKASDGQVMEAELLKEPTPSTEITAPLNSQAEEEPVASKVEPAAEPQKKHAPPSAPSAPAPTAQELQAADALHEWALKAMHTEPPADAVEAICRSAEAASGGRVLLRRMVGETGSASCGPALVAVVTALCDGAGASLALGIVRELVIPYVGALRTAAPRDMIAAMERFGARHWRAVVQLFDWAGGREARLNSFAAEVLARTAASLPADSGTDCLQAFCKAGESGRSATWGEDGARLVDGMVERCGTNEAVGAALVPALERNVIGMEKSVKFGKLLFTTARDVKGVTGGGRFRDAFEAVCAQCKVFLAKRALALVKQGK